VQCQTAGAHIIQKSGGDARFMGLEGIVITFARDVHGGEEITGSEFAPELEPRGFPAGTLCVCICQGFRPGGRSGAAHRSVEQHQEQ